MVAFQVNGPAMPNRITCGATIVRRIVWSNLDPTASPWVCLADYHHVAQLPELPRTENDPDDGDEPDSLPILGPLTVSGEFIPKVKS
jgi:hypothetical protein